MKELSCNISSLIICRESNNTYIGIESGIKDKKEWKTIDRKEYQSRSCVPLYVSTLVSVKTQGMHYLEA